MVPIIIGERVTICKWLHTYLSQTVLILSPSSRLFYIYTLSPLIKSKDVFYKLLKRSYLNDVKQLNDFYLENLYNFGDVIYESPFQFQFNYKNKKLVQEQIEGGFSHLFIALVCLCFENIEGSLFCKHFLFLFKFTFLIFSDASSSLLALKVTFFPHLLKSFSLLYHQHRQHPFFNFGKKHIILRSSVSFKNFKCSKNVSGKCNWSNFN